MTINFLIATCVSLLLSGTAAYGLVYRLPWVRHLLCRMESLGYQVGKNSAFFVLWGLLHLLTAEVNQHLEWTPASWQLVAKGLIAWPFVRSLWAQKVQSRLLTVILASLASVMILDELGWWQPLVVQMDQTFFSVGTIQLSLWAMIKGAVLVASLLWFANLGLGRFESQFLMSGQGSASAKILVAKLVRVGVLCAVTLWGLSIAGVDTSMLALFSGTIAVGVAFGLQNVTSNICCGILLLLDRSIKPGDVIGLQDGKIYGVVNQLNARYVSIRSREGREYLIPNEYFITNKVENWSYSNRLIRCGVGFRVTADADLDLVESIILEVINAIPRVLPNPEPAVRFKELMENWVDLELRFWIGDPENGWSGIRSQLIRQVSQRFREEGVQVPLRAIQLSSQAEEWREAESCLS